MQFHRLAGLTVLLGLAGGLSAARAQAVPTPCLPSDTEVIVTINVQQLINSDVVKGNPQLLQHARSVLESKLQDTGAMQYLEKAGIDLYKNIKSVTFAGPGSKDADKLVLIVEGKFSPEKLKGAAEDAARDYPGAIEVKTVDNQPIFEIADPRGKTVYVAPAGSELILTAMSKPALTAALARVRANQAGSLPKGFKALLETTNDKQSLSIAATGPALARLAENAPNPNEMVAGYLKSIDGLSLAVTLTKDMQFQLGINTTNKEAADQFAKMGNQVLLMGRGFAAQKAKEDPKFIPVVEIAQTLQIASQGSNVVLRGEVSYETLGKILKNLPQKQ
jgi:hypothetical protein